MAKRLFHGACAILQAMTIEPRPASSAVPAGTWMLANRVALQIFDFSGLLCGKIVWLLRPDDPVGQPDLDHRNPDPALRQRHLCGLTIVWGLRLAGQNHWCNGIDQLDPNVVFGLFNHPSPDVGPDGTNEIDIEFDKWGNPEAPNADYTVYPAKKELGCIGLMRAIPISARPPR